MIKNISTQGKCENFLYDRRFEHDNCGIGAVVDINGNKTHKIVADALSIVENLEHRAGKDADGETGDGVGILLQISHKFFSKIAKLQGFCIGDEGDYGVGMFFFPNDSGKIDIIKKKFEAACLREGLELLGWRNVDTTPSVLGKRALDCMPCIMQCFIKRPTSICRGLDFDRKLYIARKLFEGDRNGMDYYVCSLSSRTVVYKGMFLVGQLRTFFNDLQDVDYESAIALVHSRFSTNTNPSWERAHPNRFIVHNGEINTIRGNADKMLARESSMVSDSVDIDKVTPVVNQDGSDSAMLDNALEYFVMNGMDLPLAVMVCVPEPWNKDVGMSKSKRDFYEYYATMMEPWDGPASILFSDGDVMGAVLDRNGLRPSRYYITDDDVLILSSEVGVLPIPPEKIVLKDRLRPGKMLLVDTVNKRFIRDEDLKDYYANRHTFGEWLDDNLVHLKDIHIPNEPSQEYSDNELVRLQRAFGYTYEVLKTSILPMAKMGVEPVAAMGADTPIAVLSGYNQPMFNYFKQLFAQVTNPPIDAIREEVVTSTCVYLGKEGNILKDSRENCRALKINNPILTETDLMKIMHLKKGFSVCKIKTTYSKGTGMEKALEDLCIAAYKACEDGANIIILSDKGVNKDNIAIPSLLAVSAVRQHLVREKMGTAMSLIVESGEPREVHHFATLLGYGASAIYPYLAHSSIKYLIAKNLLKKDYYAAVNDYNKSVIKGIVKIASKMGISTIQSYQGAQVFEAIGISRELVDKYFPNTPTRIEGIGIKDVESLATRQHTSAFDPLDLDYNLSLDSVGAYKLRSGKEGHLYSPEAIHLLQEATRKSDYQTFKKYTDMISSEDLSLRSILDFKFAEKPIDIEDVESVDSIVKRFKTGAMSYGSISQEAHETMAIAMNRLQAKSNSGEGGESIDRLESASNAENNRCSAIKQVASGRFGVTSRYLMSAKEIQIKMAQGAKPGEGGQLPAEKVYPWVAKTRHSTSGVGLISPPPHHDIYSIEDLAQLIYDLKNANRMARISVKLVSEVGVGTIASGVAKAGSQVILISGYDGGTGAAPRGSIYNAGLPWELGLAETHQTLMQNNLRSRVVLETDGKLMTGRDVAVAAMLGAEEFGFATAPLVTMGCVMMRVCHLDTCPVGIATQNPELRKRFSGKPEYVINFMKFVAQELREYMAKLGIKTVDELVGRVDLLKKKDDISRDRAKLVDLSKILEGSSLSANVERRFNKEKQYNFCLENTLDEMVLLKELDSALESGKSVVKELDIVNTDRTFGTIFGSEITRRHGDSLAEDTFWIKCNGSGGQSFGAFIPKGLSLELVGDSNDYFGKGLSGGKIIVYPHKASKFKRDENIIIGNVALYGATSGSVYINGVAGERFCVRNSGAIAVVEGVGDHGCEYMTGGTVLVIGDVGKNFAAGMSGGIAYVLDNNKELYMKLNKELVYMDSLSEYDIQEIRKMLEAHVKYTGSDKAGLILGSFDDYIGKFRKIMPYDYDRMLRTISEMESKGLSKEEAEIQAFYANTRK